MRDGLDLVAVPLPNDPAAIVVLARIATREDHVFIGSANKSTLPVVRAQPILFQLCAGRDGVEIDVFEG